MKLALSTFSLLVLGMSFSATAKLVEDGESFRGRYRVETQLRDCGYDPSLENSILGLVDVYGQTTGVIIESVVAHYSVDGGLVQYFNFGIDQRPPNDIVEYVSSTHLRSFQRFGYEAPFNEVSSELHVDAAGNLTLTEQKNFGTRNLECRYTRVN